MNPNVERGHKPQGHPVGRPVGSLGREQKPKISQIRSAVESDRKDFEKLLNGSVPLFEFEEPQFSVDNPPDQMLSPEDILEEAKVKLAFMNSEESVKRYLMKELSLTEKEAKSKLTELKKDLKKDFNEYIKSYSEKNILAVKAMFVAAMKRGDIRNSTELIKALDYMTTKYMQAGKATGNEEIEIEFT